MLALGRRRRQTSLPVGARALVGGGRAPESQQDKHPGAQGSTVWGTRMGGGPEGRVATACSLQEALFSCTRPKCGHGHTTHPEEFIFYWLRIILALGCKNVPEPWTFPENRAAGRGGIQDTVWAGACREHEQGMGRWSVVLPAGGWPSWAGVSAGGLPLGMSLPPPGS